MLTLTDLYADIIRVIYAQLDTVDAFLFRVTCRKLRLVTQPIHVCSSDILNSNKHTARSLVTHGHRVDWYIFYRLIDYDNLPESVDWLICNAEYDLVEYFIDRICEIVIERDYPDLALLILQRYPSDGSYSEAVVWMCYHKRIAGILMIHERKLLTYEQLMTAIWKSHRFQIFFTMTEYARSRKERNFLVNFLFHNDRILRFPELIESFNSAYWYRSIIHRRKATLACQVDRNTLLETALTMKHGESHLQWITAVC